MTITELKERIEKKEAQIERKQNTIEKKEAQIEKGDNRFWIEQEEYWA